MNPEPAEAIPQDAEAEQVTPADSMPAQQPEEPVPTPRETMMNHIIEKREQYGDELPDDPEPVSEPQSLTVKIDGIEQQIPIDQAKATIQKNMAADKRLNDAVLKQQQLQQWEQRLQQQEQQLQHPVNSPDPSTHGEDTKEKLQAAVDALYDGDTDDAVKALSEVIGRNTATLTPDQISQQATEQVLKNLQQQKFNEEVAEGNRTFKTEFSDIANDPILHNMADQKTIELMTIHQDWSPTQIIKEAGRQTREWVKNLTGQSSPTRAERKQQLQDMPRSTGSVAYQPPAPSEGPKTPQQVISAMRNARGQA